MSFNGFPPDAVSFYREIRNNNNREWFAEHKSDYANLVEHVVPVIRELDPDAKVIVPGMHGDWVNGYPGYGEFQQAGK